jgi:hypothetical protein
MQTFFPNMSKRYVVISNGEHVEDIVSCIFQSIYLTDHFSFIATCSSVPSYDSHNFYKQCFTLVATNVLKCHNSVVQSKFVGCWLRRNSRFYVLTIICWIVCRTKSIVNFSKSFTYITIRSRTCRRNFYRKLTSKLPLPLPLSLSLSLSLSLLWVCFWTINKTISQFHCAVMLHIGLHLHNSIWSIFFSQYNVAVRCKRCCDVELTSWLADFTWYCWMKTDLVILSVDYRICILVVFLFEEKLSYGCRF